MIPEPRGALREFFKNYRYSFRIIFIYVFGVELQLDDSLRSLKYLINVLHFFYIK